MQYALDTFFGSLQGGVVGLREVTKSAFSQARKKLKASAFISLNRFWTEQWHETLDFQRWCEHQTNVYPCALDQGMSAQPRHLVSFTDFAGALRRRLRLRASVVSYLMR